jgi:putative tricarboxylic transport membrane protein
MHLPYRSITALLASALILVGCGSDEADNKAPAGAFKPKGPVELVIPFSPGGGLDLAGRLVAKHLDVGVQIQPQNFPGGAALVGMTRMAVHYKGDDQKLMIIPSHILTTPLLQQTPLRYSDFTPLAVVFSEYGFMSTLPDSPLKSVGDLVESWKTNPGKLKIGGASAGSADQMIVGKLALAAGVNPEAANYLPYDGGTGVPAILGGHVDAFMAGNEVIDLIEGGKLRGLAVSSPERLPGRFKDIPTFKEQGFDVTHANWRLVAGPPGMSPEAAAFYKNALTKMNDSPEWKAELAKYEWANTFRTEGVDDYLAEENEIYTKVFKSLGLIK